MTFLPVPAAARDPGRVDPGELLAALGDIMAPGRAAEVYAALGYPVLPCFEPAPGGGCTCRAGAGCDRPGKHPRIRGGVWQATTDPATVRRWWRRWPMANVALRTGPGSFDAADVDSADGVEALRAVLHTAAVAPPAGPLARTGGRGWHLLVAPTGLGCPIAVLPGVDWRGRGGYILVSPSRHPSGRRYRWIRPLRLDLPEVPTALRRLLEPSQPAPPPRALPAPAAGGGVWGGGAGGRVRPRTRHPAR